MNYRLYIDEVGNADLKASADPRHQYLSLTGVIMDYEYVATHLGGHLHDLKWRHFGTHPDGPPLILHRKEMMNRVGPFSVLANAAKSEAFDANVFDLLDQTAFIVITAVIDKQAHLAKYGTWSDEPYHYCLRVLIERYVMFLSGQYASGDVMSESRGAKEDRGLKAAFNKIYDQGTEFLSKTKVQLRLTSWELKVSPKTDNVPGLQLADLIAHPSWRATIRRRDGHPLDANFGGKLAKLLEEQKYRRSSKGQIWGFGRIWLP